MTNNKFDATRVLQSLSLHHTCSNISVMEALASGFSPSFLPSAFSPARIGLMGFVLSGLLLISTLSSNDESISVLLEFLQTLFSLGFFFIMVGLADFGTEREEGLTGVLDAKIAIWSSVFSQSTASLVEFTVSRTWWLSFALSSSVSSALWLFVTVVLSSSLWLSTVALFWPAATASPGPLHVPLRVSTWISVTSGCWVITFSKP